MTRHLGLALPLSLALHVAIAAGALTLMPRRDSEHALFIDLTVPREANAPGVPMPPTLPGVPRVKEPERAGRHSTQKAAVASTTQALMDSPSLSWPLLASSPTAPAPDVVEQRHEDRRRETDSGSAVAPMSAPAPEPARASAPAGDQRPTGAAEARGGAGSAGAPGAATTAAAAATAGPVTTAGAAATAGAARGTGNEAGAIPATSGGGGRAPGPTSSLAVGGGMDTPGAEYGPYLAGIRRAIAESLRYPFGARRRRLTGTVQIEIVIRADGTIAAADVVASSSHAILDEAAVETVRSLRPAPFPANVPPRTLRVRLPVVFTLE